MYLIPFQTHAVAVDLLTEFLNCPSSCFQNIPTTPIINPNCKCHRVHVAVCCSARVNALQVLVKGCSVANNEQSDIIINQLLNIIFENFLIKPSRLDISVCDVSSFHKKMQTLSNVEYHVQLQNGQLFSDLRAMIMAGKYF